MSTYRCIYVDIYVGTCQHICRHAATYMSTYKLGINELAVARHGVVEVASDPEWTMSPAATSPSSASEVRAYICSCASALGYVYVCTCVRVCDACARMYVCVNTCVYVCMSRVECVPCFCSSSQLVYGSHIRTRRGRGRRIYIALLCSSWLLLTACRFRRTRGRRAEQ